MQELTEDAGFEISDIQMAGFPLESLPDTSLLKKQQSKKIIKNEAESLPVVKNSSPIHSETSKDVGAGHLKHSGSGKHNGTSRDNLVIERSRTAETEDGNKIRAFGQSQSEEKHAEEAAKEQAVKRLEALIRMKDDSQHAGILRAAGYSLDELKSVGFGVEELTGDADFSLAEIKDAGFPATECKRAGFTIRELRKIGYTVHELSQCGYSARELEFAASMTPVKRQPTLRTGAVVKLRRAGQNAGMTRLAGYTLPELKSGGYTVAELITDGGYNISELKNCGFTCGECKASGMFSWMDLKNIGYTLNDMKSCGALVRDMFEINFTASRLHKAGYSSIDMRKAQFTAPQLRGAGFSLAELIEANFPGKELCAAGMFFVYTPFWFSPHFTNFLSI